MTIKTTSKNVYYERIKKVIEKMENHSVMILFSPDVSIRNKDINYSYRTSSDLLYLTGIKQEKIILLIQKGSASSIRKNFNPQFHVFFEEKTEEQIRWTGNILSKQEISEKLNMSSSRNLHLYSKFWEILPRLLKNKSILYHSLGDNSNIDKRLIKICNQLERKNSFRVQTVSTFMQSKFILHEFRLIKDGFEIKKIKKACNISSNAFKNLLKYIHKNNSNKNKVKRLYEYELKSYIEFQFKKKGAQALAYPSITAIGNNATFLHYEEESYQAQENDLLLIDAGCEWDGYSSDITRTYPLSGKFTSAQKKIYTIVLNAQKEAIKKCIMGYTLDDVHQIAVETLVNGLWDLGLFQKLPTRILKKSSKRKDEKSKDFFSAKSKEEVIQEKYYLLYYMHRTSHFMGLDVHDVGSYYMNKKPRKLEEGMVFTVEPGLYFPEEYDFIPKQYRGIGCRIEDDILITKNGNKVLTFAPKEIDEIENKKSFTS